MSTKTLELISSSNTMETKRGSGDPDLENGNCDIYDVFISFRGEDTRTNFTSHFHAALSRKQIKAFIDNEDLRTGHEISGSLLKAIETSKLYLVIFSPGYGSSRWCLLELEKILLCSSQHGRTVVPVFYKVEPSHVREQTGSFGVVFTSKHEGKEEKEKVLNWRAALTKAANLKAWHLNNHKPESEFIDEIVAVILRELEQMLPLSIPSNVLVGVSPHIEKIVSLLRMDSPQVRSVGIWGMGGMGKTTIADRVLGHVREKSVFGGIHRQFDGCYFFGDVRKELKGKDAYFNKLVSKILEGENSSFGSDLRLPFVKQRLLRKKVFIVFDDVDDSTSLPLKELAEHHELFGMGSKILMTSRDKHALEKFNVDEVYEFVGLKDEEALTLFSLKAFKKELPPVEYLELSSRVVRYARGNALALTVLGSALFNRDEAYWHSALKRIEKLPKKSIIDLLRISYDGLSAEEKDVFLDIICFFKGEDADEVEHLLNDLYDCVHSIMINLIDKSLIRFPLKRKIEVHEFFPLERRIEVHDLVEEMGLKMVDEEVAADPRKYKRLYNSTDIYRVLTDNKGIKTIQGIRLNMSEWKNMNFEVEASFNLVNLRWLKIYGQHDQDVFFKWLTRINVFFPQLRLLYWEKFPLRSLSSTFNAPNLVKLSLPRSKVERLWSGVKDVVNLKWMDLSFSENLIEIPDMSKAKSMEHMDFFGCFNLIRLHPSVQHLINLEVLDVSCCHNLCEIPKLESKVMKNFNIFDCPNITKFPEMPSSLEILSISETGIEELPSSLQFLTRLKYFRLTKNKNLRSISSNIFTLESLMVVYIERCGLISFIPELPQSLQVETISASNNHSQLRSFTLLDCPELDHESFRNTTTHVFFKPQVGKDMKTIIQGREIPEWFPPQNVCVGSSAALQLPPDLDDNCSFTGFAFLVAAEYNPRIIGHNMPLFMPRLNLKFRIYDHHLLVAEMEIPVLKSPISSWRPLSDHVIMHSFSRNSDTCQVIREILSGKYYSNPKISFHFTPKKPSYVVKKCGIYLELDHESLRVTDVFFKQQVGRDKEIGTRRSEIPEWFPPQNVCVGSSVILQLPPNLDDNCSFRAFEFFVELEFTPRPPTFLLGLPHYLRYIIYDHDLLIATIKSPLPYKYIWRPSDHVVSDHVVVFGFPLDSKTCQVIREILSGKYYSNPTISFQFTPAHRKFVVKKCGIHLEF